MLTALAPSSLKTVCATFRQKAGKSHLTDDEIFTLLLLKECVGVFRWDPHLLGVEAIATPVDAARTTAESTAQGTAVVLELN